MTDETLDNDSNHYSADDETAGTPDHNLRVEEHPQSGDSGNGYNAESGIPITREVRVDDAEPEQQPQNPESSST